jgi:hypothetical protein
MQISGVSLALTWPCRLCLLRVLLCVSCCYKFSLSTHTGGGDTAPTFSGLRVYLQLTWELSSPSPVEFSSLRHSHRLSHSWLLGASPHSCPLWCSVRPTLFPTCLYCFYCLLLSFSFFPPGGGRSVQGAILIWPRVVCGSTTVLLSSPCLCLPKPSGHGRLAALGPSWFLRLM